MSLTLDGCTFTQNRIIALLAAGSKGDLTLGFGLKASTLLEGELRSR